MLHEYSVGMLSDSIRGEERKEGRRGGKKECAQASQSKAPETTAVGSSRPELNDLWMKECENEFPKRMRTL